MGIAEQGQAEALLSISVPPLGEMLAGVFVVDASPGPDLHKHQHKCSRDVIREFVDILATPTLRIDQVCIVASKERYSSSSWKDSMKEFGLSFLSEHPVDDGLFETALKFSIISRLAPEWNRVGGALIQGKDFLQLIGKKKFNRIDLAVHSSSNGQQLYVQLRADVVNLYPLDLCQLLGLEGSPTQKLRRKTAIPLESAVWATTLPKLSKGQVVSVSAHLPPSSGFLDYAKLRDFWAHSYGYELPTPEPSFYANVLFRLVGPPLFSYPSCCLLGGPPAKVPRSSPAELNRSLANVIRSLSQRVPTVCGLPLKLAVVRKPQEPLSIASFVQKRKKQNGEEDSRKKVREDDT